MKIVLDAMGGDFAPQNEVQGALMALRAASNRFEVLLVLFVLRNLPRQLLHRVSFLNTSQELTLHHLFLLRENNLLLTYLERCAF